MHLQGFHRSVTTKIENELLCYVMLCHVICNKGGLKVSVNIKIKRKVCVCVTYRSNILAITTPEIQDKIVNVNISNYRNRVNGLDNMKHIN